MKKSTAWLILTMLTIVAACAAAASIDGKWTAQVPGPQGDAFDVTFVFKAEGEKLTGTIGSSMGEQPITEGKIAGDAVSFVLVFSSPDGERKMRIVFQGKLAGDQIKMKQTFEGGPGGPDGGGFPPIEYVANRAK